MFLAGGFLQALARTAILCAISGLLYLATDSLDLSVLVALGFVVVVTIVAPRLVSAEDPRFGWLAWFARRPAVAPQPFQQQGFPQPAGRAQTLSRRQRRAPRR